ncbi:MAG: NUDIX domain-containing protein [Bosea sp. (in: a-proteobacteria)]
MGEREHGSDMTADAPPVKPEGFRFRPVSRLLHLWWRFSRGMTLGVRGLVIDGEGRVLLVRHSYMPGWHLPGGGVEPGQSLADALEAELAQEANIILEGSPRFLGFYFNAGISQRDHVGVFVVRAFRQTAPHVPDREIREAKFFARDVLPPDVTAGTLRRIAEALDDAQITPRW